MKCSNTSLNALNLIYHATNFRRHQSITKITLSLMNKNPPTLAARGRATPRHQTVVPTATQLVIRSSRSSNNWYSNKTITSGCKQSPVTLFEVLLVKQRNNGRGGGFERVKPGRVKWSYVAAPKRGHLPRKGSAQRTIVNDDGNKETSEDPLSHADAFNCDEIDSPPFPFEETIEQIWIWWMLIRVPWFHSFLSLSLFISIHFLIIYENK